MKTREKIDEQFNQLAAGFADTNPIVARGAQFLAINLLLETLLDIRETLANQNRV